MNTSTKGRQMPDVMTMGVRCGDCRRISFPHTRPVWHAPDCRLGGPLSVEPLETSGQVWSYTVLFDRQASSSPARFVVAVHIDRQEVLVVGCFEELGGMDPAIGMKVELVTERLPGQSSVPRWRSSRS